MNKLVKDALILTAITLIAGVCLGGVYEITKKPIAKAQEAATQAAYKEVFEDASNFETYKDFDAKAATKAAGYDDVEIINCVVAKDKSGETLGYVITVTSHAGYGGDITFSMGVTNEGVLNGYSITDISETAGLGMKATEDAFMSQFKGIPAQTLEVTKAAKTADTEIEAISGATITSKAVTYGVDAGLAYFNSFTGGAANE